MICDPLQLQYLFVWQIGQIRLYSAKPDEIFCKSIFIKRIHISPLYRAKLVLNLPFEHFIAVYFIFRHRHIRVSHTDIRAPQSPGALIKTGLIKNITFRNLRAYNDPALNFCNRKNRADHRFHLKSLAGNFRL